MANYRGQDGYLATGGILVGSPVTTAALSAGAVAMSITGSPTLRGVVMPGDTFQLQGETGSPLHTVTGVAKEAVGNAIAGITFTPGVETGGRPSGTAVLFTAPSIAEVKGWQMDAQQQVLDTSIMGDSWERCKSGLASWRGTATVHFDYDDPRQAALVDALTAETPLGVEGALVLGIQKDSTSARQWFGMAVFNSLAVNSQLGSIVIGTLGFSGKGPALPNWPES